MLRYWSRIPHFSDPSVHNAPTEGDTTRILQHRENVSNRTLYCHFDRGSERIPVAILHVSYADVQYKLAKGLKMNTGKR